MRRSVAFQLLISFHSLPEHPKALIAVTAHFIPQGALKDVASESGKSKPLVAVVLVFTHQGVLENLSDKGCQKNPSGFVHSFGAHFSVMMVLVKSLSTLTHDPPLTT